MKLPADSVRGRIREYLERNAAKLKGPVLEIGSMRPTSAWWFNNRTLADVEWLGVDIQTGEGVDQIANVESLPFDSDRFGAVICSEALEHIWDVWTAISEMRRVLKPGGWIIITTLTAFIIHAYPDDYWRFTPSCMKRLLSEAGFFHVSVESAGEVVFTLNDHGESGTVERPCPIHVFAIARK